MPRRSGRYLRQQKLSDQNFRKIIRCFAQGLSPKQAANAEKDRPAASVNAIYEIYHLLRKRLFEIGYFPSFETIKRYLEEETAEPPLGPRQNLILQAIGIIKSRRGIKESTEFIHLSELVFRILETEATVESMVQDIERLIKITGPLNDLPRNQDRVDAYMHQRLAAQHAQNLRRLASKYGHDDGLRSLIEMNVKAIENPE